MTIKLPCATEAKEQEALIKISKTHPITRDYLHSTPNEGKRSLQEGVRFKSRGLSPGFPDLSLPYPVAPYHGLYLELKRRDGKYKPTVEQLEWLNRLKTAGYYANVAYGWEDAWKQIMSYLQADRGINVKTTG